MKIKKICNILAITITLLSSIKSMAANTISQTINFNAIFYGGTCEISAPAELSFNNGKPIFDNEIPGEGYFQKFYISLANCQGYFMAPKISVTGNTITTNDGARLFSDSVSTTKGYGVRLITNGNANFNANTNIAANSIISAKNWPTLGSDDMNKLNGPLELTGYLSCGACTPSAGLQNGELKATVTFTFLYN